MRSFKPSPEKSVDKRGATGGEGRAMVVSRSPLGERTTASTSPAASMASIGPYFLKWMASKVGIIFWEETPRNAGGLDQLAAVMSCHLFLASCPPDFPGSLLNENDVTYRRIVLRR